MKRILCFGDSNTYGQKDNGDYSPSGRYGVHERWTGIIAHELKGEAEIIEEGLGGRTTDQERLDSVEDAASWDGFSYFKACFMSHVPLDVVLLMLGTNDLKDEYARSNERIIKGLERYITFVAMRNEKTSHATRLILLAPPVIPEAVEGISEEKCVQSKELVKEIADLALREGIPCIDTNKDAQVGEDGLHLDKTSHNKLAESVLADLRGLGVVT